MNSLDIILPDPEQALEFLQSVHPGRPWSVTAIWPDRKRIVTRSFNPQMLAEAIEWLRGLIGVANLYWAVNPPKRAIDKKTKLEDITEIWLLHVDIDPRAGEDFTQERERILSLLTDRLPASVPEPSFIIDSGGGFQGFWLLTEPLRADGDLNLAEVGKGYNQQLELIFGGDSCSNIDRIMRLPSTVNIPDERKRRKGRKPALTGLVRSRFDLRYPIERFTAAPAVRLKGTSDLRRSAMAGWNPAEMERVTDINELDDYSVPDRIKVAIVQGKDHDHPKEGDNSRSAWVLDVTCQLIRNKVPLEKIFSILTDPNYRISESILEKGSSAARYAARQIERATDFAVDPLLHEFNERFAVVGSIGGKCRIIQEVMDPLLERPRLVKQAIQDFKHWHLNRRVRVGEREVPAADWWLNHPNRRTYDRIVFAPAREVEGAYNLWQGFAFDARPGAAHQSFLEHLRNNVCKDEPTHYAYLLGWMARAVQRPSQQGEVAVVLRGGKGVGKSFVAREFGKLFGRHYLSISNPSHLVGNFNAHLRDAVFLFADEAFYAGDKKHESILKTLITEGSIAIEAKGVDVETSPNCVHLMMAANDDHVVRASADERRFCVLDVGTGQQQNAAYFGAILTELQNGGYENLLHFLLTYDLGGFDVRQVPRTSALRDQQESTLSDFDRLWFEMLQTGEVPFHCSRQIDGRPMLGTLKLQAYVRHVLRRDVSLKRIGDTLRNGGAERTRQHGAHWVLPPLPIARHIFDSTKFAATWDDSTEWHVPPADWPAKPQWSADVPF